MNSDVVANFVSFCGAIMFVAALFITLKDSHQGWQMMQTSWLMIIFGKMKGREK